MRDGAKEENDVVAWLSERIDGRAEALNAKLDEDQVSVPSDIPLAGRAEFNSVLDILDADARRAFVTF